MWIEILKSSITIMSILSHSLRGLCGLKFNKITTKPCCLTSQPARAVWIEIKNPPAYIPNPSSQPARAVWIEIPIYMPPIPNILSHSLRGLCGLKSYTLYLLSNAIIRHSLRGLCGLKSCQIRTIRLSWLSQPARAVWIEMWLGNTHSLTE